MLNVHSANATDAGAVPVYVSFNSLAKHFYTAYALPAGYGNARTAFYAATKEEVTGIPSTDTMVEKLTQLSKATSLQVQQLLMVHTQTSSV